MSEMVERVAKILWSRRMDDEKDAERMVRDLLKAMREPTKAMTKQGDEAAIETLRLALKDGTPAAASWRAMIDEALR